MQISLITDDPTDNRLLEYAVAGKANWIVSGDEHLLGIATYQRVRNRFGPRSSWLAREVNATAYRTPTNVVIRTAPFSTPPVRYGAHASA